MCLCCSHMASDWFSHDVAHKYSHCSLGIYRWHWDMTSPKRPGKHSVDQDQQASVCPSRWHWLRHPTKVEKKTVIADVLYLIYDFVTSAHSFTLTLTSDLNISIAWLLSKLQKKTSYSYSIMSENSDIIVLLTLKCPVVKFAKSLRQYILPVSYNKLLVQVYFMLGMHQIVTNVLLSLRRTDIPLYRGENW